MIARTVHVCGLAMLLFMSMAEAHAQTVAFRTIEEDGSGVLIEVSAQWRASLSAVIDSVGISEFDRSAAHALTFGLPRTSETYELAGLPEPRITVLHADYDEISLPAGTDSLDTFQGPVVFAAGLGMSRRQPMISLVARLLTYEGGSVRRYRRIRVRMEYAEPAGRSALRTTGVAGMQASAASNPHVQVTESVLAEGTIYKIPITEEGVYKIDRAFLEALTGLAGGPDAIDPNEVRIYGNGGAPLPALNSAPRPIDLIENAVLRRGGGDGSFDEGDAVIFYAKGPRGWRYTPTGWEHYTHPFSNENYYFIEIGGADGAGVGSPDYPGFTDAQQVNEVTGRFVHDFDEFIWSKENGSGHTWVSQKVLQGGSRAVLNNQTFPGFSGGTLRYEVRVAIRSNPRASVLFESDGAVIGEERARAVVPNGEDWPSAEPSTAAFEHQVESGAPLTVTMRLDDTQNAPEAAVDWLRVFYPQNLTASGDSLRFTTPPGATGRFEMVLRGFSTEPHVWDVTDHASIRRLGVRRTGDTYRVQVQVSDSLQPRELFAFVPASAHPVSPAGAIRVENQNLHGIAAYPDFVIVTPQVFRSSAEELAERRRAEGLTVVVTNVAEIYNEFSGGVLDVRAIRDYFHFLYDRATDEGRRLKYALLFGDGHFNYRNLGGETQVGDLENWIPPYETEDSFDAEASYTSDDYFGLLDDHEGVWPWPGRGIAGNERVDIGVGRFPVQTPEEAAAMIAKIKHYESAATYGSWRKRYLLVADDHYNGVRPRLEDHPDLHTQNSDVISYLIEDEAPRFNVSKIYGLSYTREFQNGWRLPGVERDIQAALNDGVLVMNYSGHGGEYSLAQEEILTKEDALALRNYDRLPVFITATCSFGWWDLAKDQSAAEALLLNPEGGAIALMTTVRLVYTSWSLGTLNVGLNRALNSALLQADEQGLPPRLGDALVAAKNTEAGLQGNNRKFNLLGDPTMRIGYPVRRAAIETVNGTPVEQQPKLSALDEVTVTGHVLTPGGQVDSDFSGQVSLTVFDSERRVQLPVQDRMPQNYYTVREDLIWRGTIPASGGRFEATFVVPKDISYSNQPGRISAYAYNAQMHAGGYTDQAVVGGTAANPPDDSEGPAVTLFLNDTTFVSGGLTPSDPRLIVKLNDDSGINIVGAGVGHEMLLVVDGDEQNAVNISDGFESDANSSRSGRVVYSFEEYPVELDDGPHKLSVRAWDVLNNSTVATLDFFVSSAQDLVLQNVYNYPNPTSGHTRFIFEHNQPSGTPAEVQLRIYTLAGRPIRTLETEEALPSGILTAGPVQIPWDGRDEDFNPLASGIYLYKLRVAAEGPDGERRISERIEKLAIIR